MLSRNFSASEFLNKKCAPVTTLQTVYEFQKFRDKVGMPVAVKGSAIMDGKLLTAGDIEGSDNDRPAFRQLQSIDAMTMPAYGPKAAFSDEFMKVLDEYFANEGGLSGRVRARGTDINLYIAVLAMLQVGYREKTDNDNVFGAELKLNKVSWCALLYHWLVRKLGEVSPGSVQPYKFDARYSNSRYTFERAPVSTRQLAEIKPGYAVVWARNNGTNPRAGHTAVCVHNDLDRKIIMVVEGNTGNGVQLSARYWKNINSKNLEFVGGCSYVKQEEPFTVPIIRPGTWTGSIKEDSDSYYV